MTTDSDSERSARFDPRFDPTQPLFAWLTAVQELSSAALSSVEQVGQLTQTQWELLRKGMALMFELPMSAVEDGTRELIRLREALRAVQLQMALVESQLNSLEELLHPVKEWSRAWRDLAGS